MQDNRSILVYLYFLQARWSQPKPSPTQAERARAEGGKRAPGIDQREPPRNVGKGAGGRPQQWQKENRHTRTKKGSCFLFVCLRCLLNLYLELTEEKSNFRPEDRKSYLGPCDQPRRKNSGQTRVGAKAVASGGWALEDLLEASGASLLSLSFSSL